MRERYTNMKKMPLKLWFLVWFSLLFSTSANAYIDPSAMTYIIQIIAGVAIAAGAAFGYYFRRLTRVFSWLKKDGDVNDGGDYYEDDEDDVGFGDYELPDTDFTDETDPVFLTDKRLAPAAEVKASAAGDSGSGYVHDEDGGGFDDFDDVLAAAYEAARDGGETVTASAAVDSIDKYDEMGGIPALEAENRELRLLLKEEREKVRVLIKALHVCTEQNKSRR